MDADSHCFRQTKYVMASSLFNQLWKEMGQSRRTRSFRMMKRTPPSLLSPKRQQSLLQQKKMVSPRHCVPQTSICRTSRKSAFCLCCHHFSLLPSASFICIRCRLPNPGFQDPQEYQMQITSQFVDVCSCMQGFPRYSHI
ncbi:hypothetical protein XENOCAPTIV_027541 [Xenoophorus captivus]|uniref:Uncharacterized protein n=1 Tax=Xenoophorus captivus TaxID=1517983 RepID=A0ABV0QPM3_9TELE